ncbi:MAG: hypothetical protein HYX32_10420 [Actinobacteria bacterium]|nr:hypothetical protein [Actinomycetota bacterium]
MSIDPPLPRPDSGLRFGVMCKGLTFRRWQADVVRQLVAIDGVEPALLIIDARPPADRSAGARARRLTSSSTALWDTYNNGWIARRSRALRPVRMDGDLGALPRVEALVRREGYSELFDADDIEEIRQHDLDFILRFAFGIIRGDILYAARFGVWSFHHDDEEAYRGSPPAFWELVEDTPVTGAVLQRLTDRLDGGRILDKGWFPTARHSYVKNTDLVHLGGTDWPASQARLLLSGAIDGEGVPSTSTAPVYKKPDNGRTFSFLAHQAGRFVQNHARGLAFADHWEVGLVRAPISSMLDLSCEPSVEWLPLGKPGSWYAADPFLLRDGTRTMVLYEHFDARSRVGTLWEADIDRPAEARPVDADLDAHASYPYAFEADGRTIVVPQLAEPGVHLYERKGGRLEPLVSVLPDVRLLDPTMLFHDGLWWLFGTRPGSSSLTKLWGWWAPALEGPWTEHTANPIKTDVRSARPAGTPFVHDGRLYRPAQDCSTGYGAGVALCEVLELGPQRFRERLVRVLRPSTVWPNRQGMHTLSGRGDLTVLDARRYVVDPHESVAELRGRVARVRGRARR